MTEFKPYMRAPLVADGKLKVHFEEVSSNTLTMVKLEHPIIIPEIEEAGRWARRYITIHGKELGQMSDPYKELTLELRNSHPALNGKGEHRYILSDEGFHDLIEHAWIGVKTAAGTLYDMENQRAAALDGHKFSKETSKTYRKKSKARTRQMKQTKRGRPRKNST